MATLIASVSARLRAPWTLLLVGASALTPSAAFAGPTSLLSGGLSLSAGVDRTTSGAGTQASGVTVDLGARVRLFHVLGAELELTTPLASLGSEDRVIGLRGSALLYVVPTSVIGVYGKAGVGYSTLGALTSGIKNFDALHAGGGLEVYLGESFALTAELLAISDMKKADEHLAHFLKSLDLKSLLRPDTLHASFGLRWVL